MPYAPGRVGGRARVGRPARKKDMHVRNAAHPGKKILAQRHMQHAQAALAPRGPCDGSGKANGRVTICICCCQAIAAASPPSSCSTRRQPSYPMAAARWAGVSPFASVLPPG